MTQSTVAVGIPVYNGERWLRMSIESILSQTYTDLELQISDNASTDGTEDICRDFAKSDGRIRYVRNARNVGVFRNFDLAFARTSSRYFKWCAVGDSCATNFIARAVATLEAEPEVVLVHATTGLTGKSVENPEQYLADLHLMSNDPVERFRDYLEKVRLNNVMSGLIRSEELRKTCLNRDFPSSDQCMMAELALYGKFFQLPEELLFRRMESDSATALKSDAQMQEFFAHERDNLKYFREWKFQLTLLSAVAKSPVSARDKARLLVYCGRRARWKREVMFQELAGWLFRKT